jgi:hypothetical protein
MTQIKLNDTFTEIRGGGYGARAWIAKITGRDEKYGLARAFCRKDSSGASRSGRSGVIRFDVTEPGVYEFRDFCVGSTANNWNWSGFVRIDTDGTVTEISKADVLNG